MEGRERFGGYRLGNGGYIGDLLKHKQVKQVYKALMLGKDVSNVLS